MTLFFIFITSLTQYITPMNNTNFSFDLRHAEDRELFAQVVKELQVQGGVFEVSNNQDTRIAIIIIKG